MRRRTLLKLAGIGLARRLASARNGADEQARPRPKVVLVTTGGIRRQESFSETGFHNIPHLAGDLVQQSIFYPYTWNEGTTSHFNTIGSILTGVWQPCDPGGNNASARGAEMVAMRGCNFHDESMRRSKANCRVTPAA